MKPVRPVSYCYKPTDFYGEDTKMIQDNYRGAVVFYTYTEGFKDGRSKFTVAVFHVKFKKKAA